MFKKVQSKRCLVKESIRKNKPEEKYVLYRVSPFRGQRICGHGQNGCGNRGEYVSVFYAQPPRRRGKKIDQNDVDRFLKLAAENRFGVLLAHAPYTLNAAAQDPDVRRFAFEAMSDDLKRMEFIPGNYYNFHPGSHVGQGIAAGIEKIARLLNEIMTKDQTTTVLLETMAGKGSEIGGRFEELRDIIDRVHLKDKIGVCLDTCHVYDAGYDLVNGLDNVLDDFDRIIGLHKLKAVHLNDSKNPFASHKDRHEKLGQGF